MTTPSPSAPKGTQVWILRHGERIDHVDKTWAATASKQYDPPLTKGGHIQARKAGEYFKLKGIKFSAIYCSPMTRCLQTATEVANVLDLPINVELGAAEYVCSRWTPGLVEPLHTVIDIEQICAQFPKVTRDYFPERSFIKEVKNPELAKDVNTRMLSTLFHKSCEHENECILVVSHGQMFSETHETWLQMPLPKLPYAAIAAFERQGDHWSIVEPIHGDHWEKDEEYLAHAADLILR